MNRSAWARLDHLARTLHLYTGLFLVPWMAVYGLSAFFLNHNRWFTEHLDVNPPVWEEIRKVDFVPADSFPGGREEQARAILRQLDLDGAHRILGKPNPNQMVILRISGSGNYRITWRRKSSQLIVEKQGPFSIYRLLHFLHFRAGYNQPYAVHVIWAVIVDAVSLSIGIWVVSGVYIWARRPRKRLPGGICLAAGGLLFLGLVILLCS